MLHNEVLRASFNKSQLSIQSNCAIHATETFKEWVRDSFIVHSHRQRTSGN